MLDEDLVKEIFKKLDESGYKYYKNDYDPLDLLDVGVLNCSDRDRCVVNDNVIMVGDGVVRFVLKSE